MHGWNPASPLMTGSNPGSPLMTGSECSFYPLKTPRAHRRTPCPSRRRAIRIDWRVVGASPLAHTRSLLAFAAHIAKLPELLRRGQFGVQTQSYRRYFSSMIEKTPRARGKSEKELRARI